MEKANNVSAPNQLAALKLENEKLKKEVEVWKQKLIHAGLSHGVRAFSSSAPSQSTVPVVPVQEKHEKPAAVKDVAAPVKEPKKAKEPKKKDAGN